jgi:hypothetical protein
MIGYAWLRIAATPALIALAIHTKHEISPVDAADPPLAATFGHLPKITVQRG